MKQLAVFTFLLVSVNYCYSQQYSKSWKDLNYASDAFAYHRLDIYLPKVEKPMYPVVISIYGSAWFSNNLKGSDLSTMGKALLDAGFAVVFPNHRSSSDAKYPAQIHDIKAAIRFIRANAGTYQFDTSFIGITGFSSGGHLASLAGTSGSVKQYTVDSTTFDIEGNLGTNISYSSSVHAVVDWSGPIDISVMNSCTSSKGSDSPEAILIGGPIDDNKDKCALANPITYVDANDPPFLIIHGDADPLVPHCQSGLLYSALQNAGVSSQMVLVPGGGHGTGLFVDQYFKMMTDFFLSESGITGVDGVGKILPENFSISQNYPNPFNPSTTITFTLPVQTFVTLKIFDSLGREMAQLISAEMPAGTYSRRWSAEGISNGTYFYRFKAGSFTETRKLVIIK